jgi:hypothetical protein
MRRTPPEFQITAKVRSALSCHGYPLASIATAQALNPGSIEENETMTFHYEPLLFDTATFGRSQVASRDDNCLEAMSGG